MYVVANLGSSQREARPEVACRVSCINAVNPVCHDCTVVTGIGGTVPSPVSRQTQGVSLSSKGGVGPTAPALWIRHCCEHLPPSATAVEEADPLLDTALD